MHLLGFVPYNLHSGDGIYSCPSKITGGTMSQVMKTEIHDSSSSSGCCECILDFIYRHSLVQKYMIG